jgi:hypothetical protein
VNEETQVARFNLLREDASQTLSRHSMIKAATVRKKERYIHEMENKLKQKQKSPPGITNKEPTRKKYLMIKFRLGFQQILVMPNIYQSLFKRLLSELRTNPSI